MSDNEIGIEEAGAARSLYLIEEEGRGNPILVNADGLNALLNDPLYRGRDVKVSTVKVPVIDRRWA